MLIEDGTDRGSGFLGNDKHEGSIGGDPGGRQTNLFVWAVEFRPVGFNCATTANFAFRLWPAGNRFGSAATFASDDPVF